MDEFRRHRLSSEALSGLLDRIAEALRSVPGIVAAVLYGSAAEALPCRDLDIALIVDRAVWPAAQDEELEDRVARLLSPLSSIPVDVHVVNDAPPGFQYHVTLGRPFLVRDEEAYADFVERAWDMYFDFAPFIRRYFEELIQ